MKNYFEGIVAEEDVEVATESAIKILGAVDRIVYGSSVPVVNNALVMTRQHGKLWYGDLPSDAEMRTTIDALSAVLKVPVAVYRDGVHVFGSTDSVYVTYQ
jgi:hypothetical protein